MVDENILEEIDTGSLDTIDMVCLDLWQVGLLENSPNMSTVAELPWEDEIKVLDNNIKEFLRYRLESLLKWIFIGMPDTKRGEKEVHQSRFLLEACLKFHKLLKGQKKEVLTICQNAKITKLSYFCLLAVYLKNLAQNNNLLCQSGETLQFQTTNYK